MQSSPRACCRTRPKTALDRRPLPISTDDPLEKALVITLLHSIGFDAADGGGLMKAGDLEWAEPTRLLHKVG